MQFFYLKNQKMDSFLNYGKDVTGKTRTTDIFYMRVLKNILKIVTAWPEEALGEQRSKYKWPLLAFNLTIFISWLPLFITYLVINQSTLDFFQIGHVYISIFMNIVALIRQLLPFSKNYGEVSVYFVTKLHLFHHKDRSEYAMKIHLLVHKLSHYFTVLALAVVVVGATLFNVQPYINNVYSGAFNSENVTYELALYYYVPHYDLERDYNAFLAGTVINIYITVVCCCCFFFIDLYLYVMIFHLWGHLNILKHELDTFPLPSGNKLNYSEQEEEKIFTLLKTEVEYHKFIINFAGIMSDTFGFVLAVFYVFHQVCGCLLLAECSTMETKALLRYGPLTVIQFLHLIQLSVIFELIGSQSEKLINAVYFVPWERMRPRSRRVVCFFLSKVQTPISVKAMGVTSVGVLTMSTILKTTFSYFAFLRTRNI